MGRRGQNIMGRGSIYHGWGVDIPWVGGSIYHGLRARYNMGRVVDITWVGGLI